MNWSGERRSPDQPPTKKYTTGNHRFQQDRLLRCDIPVIQEWSRVFQLSHMSPVERWIGRPI